MAILISAIAGLNLASSSVSATGNEFHVITDPERQTFQINDIQLKNAVSKFFGKLPTDVFVKSSDSWPNKSWSDLYSRYNWQQVQVNMQVRDIKITDIQSQPVIIASRYFKNSSSKPATFSANISESVTNTIESNWSSSTTAATNFSFTSTTEVSVELAKESIQYSTGFSLSETWGKGGSSSQATTVGSSSGLSVSLNPGEEVVADLIATRGTMKVRVNYIVYLSGNTAVNYQKPYQGHHFWAFPIENVLNASNLPSYRIVTEDIQIGYYSNASVIVQDSHGQPKTLIAAAH